jgi:hypothetical protein
MQGERQGVLRAAASILVGLVGIASTLLVPTAVLLGIGRLYGALYTSLENRVLALLLTLLASAWCTFMCIIAYDCGQAVLPGGARWERR